ncbi:hypothetical protein [Microcoleus sp. M2_C6]|uniref:hypothetical protein n=1 Tax=unclassified Microcoleus TaxID=2642155 RepID=UPI002FD20DEB
MCSRIVLYLIHKSQHLSQVRSQQLFLLNDTVYEQLRAYFRSHNQRLAQLCDRDFGWD